MRHVRQLAANNKKQRQINTVFSVGHKLQLQVRCTRRKVDAWRKPRDKPLSLWGMNKNEQQVSTPSQRTPKIRTQKYRRYSGCIWKVLLACSVDVNKAVELQSLQRFHPDTHTLLQPETIHGQQTDRNKEQSKNYSEVGKWECREPRLVKGALQGVFSPLIFWLPIVPSRGETFFIYPLYVFLLVLWYRSNITWEGVQLYGILARWQFSLNNGVCVKGKIRFCLVFCRIFWLRFIK